MSDKTTASLKTISRIDWVLYCVAVSLVPCIFLFDLYNRNRIQNHIPFGATLVVAAVLVVVSLAVFLLLRWIVRNLEGALIITSLWWVTFWLFESSYAVMLNFTATLSRMVWLSLIVIGLAVIAACFRRYEPPFGKISPVFRILAATLCGLFVFNFVPGVQHQIMLQGARANDGERAFYIKREFNVDASLPSPDIYWFHMDGMLSLETVESFFGECQDWLRKELAERGFFVYEDAALNAGDTGIALPALFSPNFYDTYYAERLSEIKQLLINPRRDALNRRLAQDGISLVNDVTPYHEMFHALMSANYEIVLIAGGSWAVANMPFTMFYRIWPPDDNYPMIKNDNINRSFLTESSDLFNLLTMVTPLSFSLNQVPVLDSDTQWLPISDHTEKIDQLVETRLAMDNTTPVSLLERRIYRRLVDSFYVPSPKFLFLQSDITHGYNWHLAAPTSARDTTRVDLYMPAHNYASAVMLNAIDAILKQTPNAVIVLQSDHGFHLSDTQEHLLRMGYTDEEVLELFLSVFSAVRIPSQYGGLDAPLAPLNISRELVNRFVGENYTLLPD